MRVMMVSKACVVGQYQVKLEELARHPDLELTVVVPPFWRDERGVLTLERLHTKGYQLLVEPMRLNGQFHLHYYPTLPRLVKLLKPDIVHIDEEPYNVATWLALRAARAAHAKTVFFTWQNLMRRYPAPFSWIESYALRAADYAIAGSEDARIVLRSKGYRGPLSVIPQFGVDPDLFTPAPKEGDLPATESNDRPFRIGYTGRLVKEKGVDLLIRAMEGMSGNWTLHILGSGPDRGRLERIARKLGIEDRVCFESPLPSYAMSDFFRQLDLCVLPSITRPNWREQFGRVLIEAMACQVPVLGSDCGEIPNVIGGAGLIFPEGDVGLLRDKIKALWCDPSLRREFGRQGRERVIKHFTQAQVAEETVQIYRQLIPA